jgi:hypothetical protein
MINYSINETTTKQSIKDAAEREVRLEQLILKEHPNYYSLNLRERMNIKDKYRGRH